MTVEQRDIGATCLIKTLQCALCLTVGICFLMDDPTTYGSNLTTAEEGVTHMTTIHRDVRDIHTTVIDISATKDTSTIIESSQTTVLSSLVINLLLIVVVSNLYGIEITCGNSIEMTITYEAVKQGYIGRTPYSTTLTATIGVTLNSGNTV